MYQLIAQVCGLSVLAVLTTMLLRRFHTMRWNVLWRYGLSVGVVMAGLLIIYPEVTPFLGLSFFLYHGVQVVRHRRLDQALRIGAICGTAIVVMVVAMQVYAVNSLYFLMDQAQTGNANVAVQVKLFPFYLLPSGFANLWNLQRVSSLPFEPYLSISIFIAIALTLFDQAAWMRRDARRIGDLPILNVDPELVAWGTDVSVKLSTTAGMFLGGQQEMRASVAQIGSPTPQTSDYSWNGSYYTESIDEAAYRRDLNNWREQRRAASGAQYAKTVEEASRVLESLNADRLAIRQKMTAKYNVEF
jgi:hypothetical protein